MKFRIKKSLEIDKLKDHVPAAYKGLAEALSRKVNGTVTLITFPHHRNDVVKGSLVEKAISKLEMPLIHKLVVVGGCFSSEALEKLKNLDVYYLNLSEFHWTDESHIKIKAGSPKYEESTDS